MPVGAGKIVGAGQQPIEKVEGAGEDYHFFWGQKAPP
jgi:hypothetical protein